jgi:hypothetical protein
MRNYLSIILFDQQFAHPGWSGIVSVIEDMPQTLLDTRRISLQDLIIFELVAGNRHIGPKVW